MIKRNNVILCNTNILDAERSKVNCSYEWDGMFGTDANTNIRGQENFDFWYIGLVLGDMA